MKPTEDFFSGDRYAIFGVRARGRLHGYLLIGALRKAGKTPIAIEPDGRKVKNAEVYRSLRDAGKVDGVVILPPAPWDQSSADFTNNALQQCCEQGISRIWIYTAGNPAPTITIAQEKGLDVVAGECPCLYISKGGFPHNLHRWITKRLGRL